MSVFDHFVGLALKGLKELWNYNRKLFFLSTTKIGGNTTNILNCYFQNKFTLWPISLNIYIWKTKFTSNKQYFSGLLFSRNAKKAHADQTILQTFLLCLKINVSQTCKKIHKEYLGTWKSAKTWKFSMGICLIKVNNRNTKTTLWTKLLNN